MIICETAVVILSNRATGGGRADHVARGIGDVVAKEHMRLQRHKFANPTCVFGERRRRAVFLPIVPQ